MRGDANLNGEALKRDGGVDGIRVRADYGHRLRLRRGDVDLAGWGSGGCGDKGWVDGGGHRDRGDHGVSRQVDHGDSAVLLVDDVGAGAILQDGDRAGVDADRDRGEDLTEAHGIYRVGGVAAGIGGQSGRGAERDIDDADRARVGAVAGVGDDELTAGRSEVRPER